ncbi:amidohydrolase family protein [Methanobrevibacter smithii DSM 2375]|uniref:Amidohydrolase family protein n=1 Tax=Methanobrevibacter smithii DSM 2375 TaxID=483214 RepID=B9AGU9_METSM|nr:amidohydrolase family protein [Methanobrevibacter smithii]EEE42689.1 amidohydrolase family protein [Methanobrevibacter smithii DSM 2375]
MLTIKDGIVLKGQDLTPVRENIVIDDGKIIEMAKDVCEGKIIDATDSIVCPTFLNGHTHIGDSIIKDEGYGLSLGEMVKPPNGVKHKALANAEDGEIIDAMKKSMWDMFESGTTHFIDYREGGIKGVELLRKASKNLPVTPVILGRDDSFYGQNPDLRKVKIAIRKLLKLADGIALSGFGEISDEVASLITSECRKAGKISSIHVAESMHLQDDSLRDFNKTEIQRGVDADFDQLVHCTNPRNNDLELIKNSNVVVCPRANATLNVGVAPLNEMFSKGIKPLLGSDNLMLNSPNLFRELEFSLKIMSVYYKNYLNPKDLLKTATTNICNFEINQYIEKPVIDVNQEANLFISKKYSKNPYLNIINRCGTKDILYIMNRDIHIKNV